MPLIRKLIGALLILAGLAAAGFGVWVCAYALDAAPQIEDGADGPSAVLERFLACLRRHDWSGAAQDLYRYDALGLETPPEDELSRIYWDALLATLDFSEPTRRETSGTRVGAHITVRTLDLDAVSAAVGAHVQEVLAEKVENAYLRSDVYDADGAYREDVARDALREATRDVLSDAAPYAREQDCELTLRFSGGRWLIELSPAFFSALTGGAVGG